MFRFYVDGVQLSHSPKGWDNFSATIRRSEESRIIATVFDSSLEFGVGSGYHEIASYFQANDYGALIPFRVEYSLDRGQSYQTMFSGLIDVSEATINIGKKTIKSAIADTSVGTKIMKNRSLKVSTGSDESKNGTAITNEALVNRNISLVTKQGANSRTIKVMEWDNLLDYLIDYITDAGVSVSHNWYNGITEKLYITALAALIKGVKEQELQSDYDGRPEIKPIITTSLSEAYIDVAKLFNLWMTVTFDGSNYTIEIDQEDDIYKDETAITLQGVSNEEISISQDRFFTTVRIGQEEVTNGGVYYAAGSNLDGWKRNEIQLKGQANIRDKVLDLTTSLIYSGISIHMYGLRIDVNDQTSGDDYVLSYNMSGSGQKNVLLQGTAGTIGATTLSESCFVAEADETASVADISDIGEREMLQDDVNVTEMTSMLNALMTNDQVIARHNLPFDSFITTNPNPSLDVTLKLNGDISSVSIEKGLTFGLNEDDHTLPLRSNITGGSDEYNQWSNTDYRFKPASLPGRIDVFEIGATVRVDVSAFTDEGFRAVLFVSHLINGVVYYDQIAQSNVSTATGSQALSISGRRYIPFTDDTSFKVLFACVPEGDNYLSDSDLNDWSFDATKWDLDAGFTYIEHQESSSARTENITLDNHTVENGADYRVEFDYEGSGIGTIKIKTGSTVHHTENFGLSGSVSTRFTSDFTNLFLEVYHDNPSEIRISNLRVIKYYTCEYDIEASDTEVTIEQVGYNGSAITSASPSTFKGWELDIESSCPVDQFLDLMNDPRKRIQVGDHYAWAKDLTYNFHTGSLKGILVTDFENVGDKL